MSKKTFAVLLATGAAHTIRAHSFHGEGRDVTFHDDGLSVAHFCGVESVVVQEDPAPPSALEALGSLSGSASVESLGGTEGTSPAFLGEAMLSGSVVINVYCEGAVPANVVAEAVASAVNTVHGVV